MEPYSHFVIASQLEDDIHPKLSEEYYLGAVAPDIRFVAGIAREQTHLPAGRILEFLDKYPHHASLIQGFLVQFLTDKVDIIGLLEQRTLLRPFLPHVSQYFIFTIIEAFYIDHCVVRKPISMQPNEMLCELGIQREHIELEAKTMQPYLLKPTFAATIAYLRTGNNPRLQQNASEAENIQNNPLIKPFCYQLTDVNTLNQKVVRRVRDAEEFKQICE